MNKFWQSVADLAAMRRSIAPERRSIRDGVVFADFPDDDTQPVMCAYCGETPCACDAAWHPVKARP